MRKLFFHAWSSTTLINFFLSLQNILKHYIFKTLFTVPYFSMYFWGVLKIIRRKTHFPQGNGSLEIQNYMYDVSIFILINKIHNSIRLWLNICS